LAYPSAPFVHLYTTSRGYWGKEQIILIPPEQKRDAENISVPGAGLKKKVTVFVIPSKPFSKAYLYCLLLSFIGPSPDLAEDREIKKIKSLLKEKHPKCYSQFFGLTGD
jgi:hypothetical protein